MENTHLLKKLEALQTQLIAHHHGGNPSSTSKGKEREEFITNYLEKVMPPIFRFGSGEATDVQNNTTGQLDLVIEYPLFPSIPQPVSSPKLYLAEGVAAVIEIKSDLSSQWDEVLETARKIKSLQRSFSGQIFLGDERFTKTIPVFAVGYKGWTQEQTLQDKLLGSNVDAILVIDPGLFVANNLFSIPPEKFKGPWALWGFLTCLHYALESLKIVQANLYDYAPK